MPKLPDVADLAIQDDPGNSRVHGGLGDLWETGAAHGLENDAVGPELSAALNELQDLLALLNAVIVSIEDLHSNTQVPCCFLGRRCLLHLVIVILSEKGYYDCRLRGHRQIIRRNRRSASMTAVIRARGMP